MATLGDRIARGRTKARLSQSELAKAVGVTRSWIGAVETDRIARPRPAYLRLLADQLGLDYNELLAITDQLGEAPPPPAVDPSTAVVTAIHALTAAVLSHAELTQRIVEEMAASREESQGRAEGLGAALGELTEMIGSLRPLLVDRRQ